MYIMPRVFTKLFGKRGCCRLHEGNKIYRVTLYKLLQQNKSQKQFANYSIRKLTNAFMQATAQSQPHNVRHTHTGLDYDASAASAA